MFPRYSTQKLLGYTASPVIFLALPANSVLQTDNKFLGMEIAARTGLLPGAWDGHGMAWILWGRVFRKESCSPVYSNVHERAGTVPPTTMWKDL